MDKKDNENERWLSEWYSKCRNKYMDLVCDFGGSELFVIDGDSLLFKFLYDPETDFLDFSKPFGGGQFLALTFLIENFLKKLKERECVFHIVFFNVNKSIWNNRPKLRIAREIIINHLKNLKFGVKIPLFEFKNWWNDENWKEYLDNRQPLFILTGDGSTEHLEIKKRNNYNEEINDSSILGIATKNSLKMTIVLQAFMFLSLHTNMPIALLSGMEFKDSRAYAFVFERGGNVNLETQERLTMVKNLTIKAFEVYDEKSTWFKDSVKNFKLTESSKILLTSQEEECLNVFSTGGKRMALIILSLVGVLCNNSDKSDFQYLAKIFLFHIILLDYLPLKLRTAPSLSDDHDDDKSMIESFMKNFYIYCAKIYIHDILLADEVLTRNFQGLKNNLYDLTDARLFISLIQCHHDDVLNFNDLPNEIKKQFDSCWNLLKLFCKFNGFNNFLNENNNDDDYKNFKKNFQIKINSKSSNNNDDEEKKLLSFKYEFFEEYLGDMHLKLPEDSNLKIDKGHYGLIGNVYHDDITHWHSTNPIEKLNRLNNRYDRNYENILQIYADSLINRKDKKTISVSKSPVKKESNGTKKAKENLRQEKLRKSLNISKNCFDKALIEISKDKNIQNKLNCLYTKLEKIEHPFISFQAHFKILELLVESWSEYCKISNVKSNWKIPIDILRKVFYIVKNFSKYLDNKRKGNLIEVLNRLKFTNCKKILEIMKINDSISSEKLPSFNFDLPANSMDLSIRMSETRFQMLYAGHLMDRNTNPIDDPRVSFKPDEWQVKVLDAIDNDESALICCPTSSGKTFISFYAMEKILRESDDGILVYVAPTKALVNQVTAEIYGRFSKTYKYNSKTTWGIYTREYRRNYDKCQILVTVPQMLEILILSPQRTSWARNIKRIIFDEVHEIGLDGGEYYDHLLLLTKSLPILALSATFGNPEIFHKWIARSKEIHGLSTKLIRTTKRFSDLQQYVYFPKFSSTLQFPSTSHSEKTINPKKDQGQSNSIIPINPIFSLSMTILKEHGLPDDMKLVPSQCVQLWDTMKRNMGDNQPNEFNNLDPDIYFKDIGHIIRDDADRYEQELKQVFTNYARHDTLNETIKSTIEELGTDIKNGFKELESTASDIYGDKFLEKEIVPLLFELSAQDKLPAILFHFNRKECVELALHILEQLELGEKNKRDNDKEYQAKKETAIAQKEAYKKKKKKSRDSRAKEEDINNIQNENSTIFDWEAHDPDFTFINRKDQVNSEDFEKIIEQARKKMGSNDRLLTALERGIGVHHAGLPKKYLSAVEILFRKRHLRVVIATGSLSLGINMPCKTVVFVGDSIFLTALQYRQMSGRSGRRGFDPIGHVIFFGIPLTKIIRLLMSGLPSLSGHFPLTTTLVLRSFNLLNQCKNNNVDDYNYAKNAVKGLFSESFFCLDKEYLSEQIKHHLRFSIEYLMRESLLDQKGNLINLSAMVSHLYYTEPSNLEFAVLFKHGVFHKICSKLRTKSLQEEVMNELILILSHIFSRVKLRKISEDLYVNSKYPSKIILPPLPKDVKDILKKHNERVLSIYTNYVVTFAKNHCSNKLKLDNILPLSSIKIPTKSIDQTFFKTNPLISKLESMAISFVARSPFIAMCSSRDDNFVDLEDLTNHVHSEIFLDLHNVPFIKTDENVNAYIRDFFFHGQEKALVEANGVRRGEVWQVLRDFHMILLSIVSSIKNYLKAAKNKELEKVLEEEELVLKGFVMTQKRFEEKFEKVKRIYK